MTVIQSSDLDFDNIKTNLKTYLQRSSEFADYDFEASGLSNILDVLAYNTHLNGLIANIGVNESFLGSAQLRASVVSHAEALGYYPRSKTSSQAVVNLSLATGNTAVTAVTLPANTTFTTSVDDVSYTFQTLEDYIAINDGLGNFTFKTADGSTNIPIKEGSLKTKTFIVGDTTDEQVYIIPDTTIDTSTLSVKIFDTTTSTTFTTFNDIQDQIRINTDSTVYIVREVPNGFFELVFSEGNVLGASPQAGNKIVASYLSTKAAAANNAKTFLADSQVNVGGTDFTLSVTVVSTSAAGAEEETISSIKSNAPIAFATQQRLVTAEDYKALILSRYSSTVQDVVAWGGQDNIPATFGNVYVSIRFKDGIDASAQASVKDSIKNLLSANLAIMSIDTVFSDPIDTFIELTTSFNFDPDLTGDTVEQTTSAVQTAIADFFTNNLNTFESVFRRSAILAVIDGISPAILNSSIEPKMQQRFLPTLNFLTDFSVNFPAAIAAPSATDHIITTTNFTVEGSKVFARNKLDSNTLELVDLNSGRIIKDVIGNYVAGTGVVSFTGLNVSAFESTAIKIAAIPANKSTIRPLRNYILNIDAERSSAAATVDFQNTAVTLNT